MDRFVVQGGVPLQGELPVGGAKNSALPALAACLLTAEPVTLRRIPPVRDVHTMQKLLERCGASIGEHGEACCVQAAELPTPEAPYDLVKTMRASSLVLGPLLARCGRARVSMPGGCAIGARPIDLHLRGLEQLGARIRQSHGYVEASAPNGLRGTTIHFDRITVTGTEDLLMAAVLAEGETVLENAAREPEVGDLAGLLTKMGARLSGVGTSTIRVQGVPRLHGAEHAIIADRIEAGTFLMAAAITRGDVRDHGLPAGAPHRAHPENAASRRRGLGTGPRDSACASARARLVSVDMTTEEYPGFATDLQAQFMALMTQAQGISLLTETIFENRFMHALELVRMGANIRIEARQAIVAGPTELTGASVLASDLRASASLVLAALVARGETVIDRVYHIDRGYENIEEKLGRAGARIRRVKSL